LERKEEGTGGNQEKRRRVRGEKGCFFCWRADRIFRCVEAEQQKARVRVNQGGWTGDEQSHSLDLIDPTE
jgi:hypothetical protein